MPPRADDAPAPRSRGVLLTHADVDLDARDPEFIGANLPLWWLQATVHHRAEVSGFEHVPDAPVMFVGNHCGGSMTPGAFLFLLAHQSWFSVDRPVHALAHALVTSLPVVGDDVKRIGVVTAGPEAAAHVFAQSAGALVYPGGDVDALRPWRRRFERRLRVKSVPVVASLPWGVSPGDWFGHLPLPTKVRIEALPPIDLRARYGEDLDVDDAHEYVRSTMQVGLSRLAAGRVLPPLR